MEEIFPKGIRFITRTPNQPDFVRGKLSIKVDEFIDWLNNKQSESGWVNLDILLSKQGKIYLKHNDFQPQGSDEIDTAEMF